MKPIHYILATILVIIWLFSAFSFVSEQNNLPKKHLEIVLRNIGHRLLLHANDSTSRVLPIQKIDENTYQISFENQFEFVPDTLINLVHQQLKTNKLPNEYIVNVLDCRKKQTIFGYEISEKTNNVIPCIGREQKAGCYLIRIEFLEEKNSAFSLVLLFFIPLFFIGFFLKTQFKKSKKIIQVLDSQEFISIGSFEFYTEKNLLIFKNNSIELSDKETKILKIFAEKPNQIIERERLMKEVWEDEGVIVISRNLDVFVSKLRKKLSSEEAVKILNVHGKGYKLVIE